MKQIVVANKASNILSLQPTNNTFDSHKLYLPSNTRFNRYIEHSISSGDSLLLIMQYLLMRTNSLNKTKFY